MRALAHGPSEAGVCLSTVVSPHFGRPPCVHGRTFEKITQIGDHRDAASQGVGGGGGQGKRHLKCTAVRCGIEWPGWGRRSRHLGIRDRTCEERAVYAIAISNQTHEEGS